MIHIEVEDKPFSVSEAEVLAVAQRIEELRAAAREMTAYQLFRVHGAICEELHRRHLCRVQVQQ